MNSTITDISVVMSVYNGATHLPTTIESVLGQGDAKLEFVVVDDGSTDDTPAILEKYAIQDRRLQVHRQDNQGLTRALIKGCSLARGEFIARQDVGDISLRSRLSQQLALLRTDPSLVLAYCAYDLIGPGGELLAEGCLRNSEDSINNSLRSLDPRTLQGPHHGTVMFRKQAYEAVGGYRPAFYFAQDLDLWVRLITVGEIAGIPDSLCQLRFGFGSLTALHRRQQFQLRQLIAEAESRRRQGLPQDKILTAAAAVKPIRTRFPALDTARAAYFVGSNLARRTDPRARGYFLQAVRANPLHLKAWVKLLTATLGNRP